MRLLGLGKLEIGLGGALRKPVVEDETLVAGPSSFELSIDVRLKSRIGEDFPLVDEDENRAVDAEILVLFGEDFGEGARVGLDAEFKFGLSRP